MKNRQAIGSAYFCFTLAGISGIIKTIFGIVVYLYSEYNTLSMRLVYTTSRVVTTMRVRAVS